ncbi:hypothetical protein EC973_009329 [Apophysomyces ossiformis]|uniref:PNPLA domain-containing protein n=1 Tax=Apophysomyces ossiformis TaxID=679940 RepID=A0A8H7BYL4_9FUNG|nr:hypothetical protein EC973_009329 [Apophysomyces ossiformis]
MLQLATTYEEWAKAATKLDELDGAYLFKRRFFAEDDPTDILRKLLIGLEKWKNDPVSSEYDWELVNMRLDQLRHIRETNQGQRAMIFALRTSLARNLGDMNKPTLYSYTRIGTKQLISDYIEEAVKQLNWICDEPSDEHDLREKHDLFMNLRQSFGRTALLLSGGGTLGLHHMGVIRCLHNERLLPRILSGASSGAIMAALVGTRTNEEIHQLFEDPSAIKLDVFERAEEPESPFARLYRLLTRSQLYDVDVLADALKSNIGDYTFQEAFNRTRWILNITVSSSTLYDMPRLLNYITAPDVAASTLQLRELGIMPSVLNMVQSILSQKYSGDITIVPEIGYTQFLKLLSNPTPEFCLKAVIAGEKATWKKMSIIKNHLQIELTIDAILYRLRLRRLGELSYGTIRPGLESRSVSELNLQQPSPAITKSLTLQDRERKATKRGLLMTAPDSQLLK